MEPNKPMLSAPHLKTYLTKRISTVCTPTTTMWYTKYVAATKGTVALPMLFLPKTLDTLMKGREKGMGWNAARCESESDSRGHGKDRRQGTWVAPAKGLQRVPGEFFRRPRRAHRHVLLVHRGLVGLTGQG